MRLADRWPRRARARAQVLDLVPLANQVEKLAGRCSHCGEPGLFSMRVAADSRQELVGGSDKYVPACRYHYRLFSQLREQQHAQAAAAAAAQAGGGAMAVDGDAAGADGAA